MHICWLLSCNNLLFGIAKMQHDYLKIFQKRIITSALLLACVFTGQAKSNNATVARQVFNKAYELVFGQQGCSLKYDVNLIGLYRTNGAIWYKGQKSKFIESRYLAWNDGKSYFLVDTKKKTVTAHRLFLTKRTSIQVTSNFHPKTITTA